MTYMHDNSNRGIMERKLGAATLLYLAQHDTQ